MDRSSEDKFDSLPPARQEEATSFLYQTMNERIMFPVGLIETEVQPKLADPDYEWLRVMKGWLLSEISRHLGSATHHTLGKGIAAKMPELCRQVIDCGEPLVN